MLIFGGTTEGRRLARALSAMGHQVWVSVATPLGAEELAGLEDVSVLVGRRSGGEMDALLSRGFHRCVDATHPYAVHATREIGAACARAGVPLRRLLRPEGGEEGLRVDSPEEAARLLAGREGNILLATGAKELPAFAALEPARLFPRVLPSEEGVAACRRAGIPSRNIIALYGPFTQRLNEALMEQYHIRAYDEQAHAGYIRHIYIRFGAESGQILVCIVANCAQLPKKKQLVAALLAAEPGITTLVFSPNTKKGNTVLGTEFHPLYGDGTITDTLCGLQFRLSAPAFYQVNHAQAERLYEKAVQLAGLTGNETVLDLYCGTGTITLCLARHAKKAIGVEIVPLAI